jgi:hypothetical protein
MDINFDCVKCGQHIVIDESGAGLKVNCPKCDTDLIVPASKGESPVPEPPVISALQSEPLVYVLHDSAQSRPGVQPTFKDDSSISCNIIYIFASDGFVRAKYFVTEQYSVTSKYLATYEDLKKSVKEKYGEPKNDNIFWLDETFKDDPNEWGIAVSAGHLSLFTLWEMTKTDITLALTGDNGSINLGIEYVSKELGQLEEKQKHDRLMNDL